MEIRRPEGFPDPARVPTVSVDEAASWLGVGRSAYYQGVQDGTLPAIKVSPHRLRVPVAALARLLELDQIDPGR